MKTFPSGENRQDLGLVASYSPLEFARIVPGVTAQEMEDKWNITFQEPWLYFHRSWTGYCVYGLRFDRTGDDVSVEESWVNCDRTQYRMMSIEYERAMVRFLIDVLMLGKPAALPDPPGETPTGLTKAVYEHVAIGRGSPATAEFMIKEYGTWWDRLRLRFRRTSRGTTTLAISIGLLAALAAIPAVAQRTVDTIVTHGKILTVDANFRVVEALAIDGGRIVARGTSAELARYAGRNTKVIDVAGATVVPGLIDNHMHFTRGADTWHQQARFEGVGSRKEALAILAAKAASLKPGDWIMVQGGWTPRQFADAPGGFTLEELDGVAPKNPLFVQEGYSVVYANSLALKAVGLNPADGARRNAQGLVSFQPPMALYDAMPKASAAQREQNLTDFMHELNAVGLTGVYSLGHSDFLAARAAKGPLPIRLWETLPADARDAASVPAAAALIERSRPNQFDGQFGIFGLGEVLYGPFFDLAPRKDPWPAEIMNEYGKLATSAARAGWHVHQHVINNNAVSDLLDTLEKVNKTQRIEHLRWTMGHVYDISPSNIARAKALGMTLGVHGAAMQAGAHMPLRKIADSGIVFGLGTDATIVSHYSPFVTLGWVVSGLDVGGNRVLDETLTREEALIAHTRSNAYLFFQEKALGSLEVGKQADLIVLDRDYMTVPAADIKRIKPTLTMVGGRVVFETR